MHTRICLAGRVFGCMLMSAAWRSDAVAAACRLSLQGEGRVETVLDTRTFKLDDGREVLLAGIEADILTRPSTLAPLSQLIAGQQVTLHGVDDRPDRYGRQAAYVFVSGSDISVQAHLLSQGEALIARLPADKECSDALKAAESSARTAKRGFWGDPAATKNTKNPGDILARIGQFTMVEGQVVSARQAGTIFYINFGRRWTRDFAVTMSRRVLPSMTAAGIDTAALEGKIVRVRGFVEKQGGPRIEAVRAEQIEIVGERAKNIISKSEGQ